MLMQITRLACSVLVVIASTSAVAATQYKLQDIGDFGTWPITPFQINEKGWAVGYGNDVGKARAFITGPNGKNIRDIGGLGGSESWAIGVNDTGMVAGEAYIQGDVIYHAFITGKQGLGLLDIGTLGGNNSYAKGVNNRGLVIGSSETLSGQSNTGWQAFIYDANTKVMKGIGTPATAKEAVAINKKNVVTGNFTSQKFAIKHAYVASPPDYVPADLAPDDFRHIQASAINDKGTIIGTLYDPTGQENSQAFIVKAGGQVKALNMGPIETFAWAIDNNDIVVGDYFDTFSRMEGAFICHNGCTKFEDFSDLSLLVRDLPFGMHMQSAVSINEKGQILCYGTDSRAYLLTPISE